MNELYRSPYEAYPFLSDSPTDLRCDFEILTDEIASRVGLLRSKVSNKKLKDQLLWIDELVYHLNPALRTSLKITDKEICRLNSMVENLKKQVDDQSFTFVIPQGSENACLAHILRVDCKKLVRLIYRYLYQEHEVDPKIIDIANLLSGYFFYLSLELNKSENVDEVKFTSRNY